MDKPIYLRQAELDWNAADRAFEAPAPLPDDAAAKGRTYAEWWRDGKAYCVAHPNDAAARSFLGNLERRMLKAAGSYQAWYTVVRVYSDMHPDDLGAKAFLSKLDVRRMTAFKPWEIAFNALQAALDRALAETGTSDYPYEPETAARLGLGLATPAQAPEPATQAALL